MKDKTYEVRKHIELIWHYIEADSKEEAKKIVQDMGESSGDMTASFEVKEGDLLQPHLYRV